MDKQRFINKVNTRCEYNKYNHIFVTDVEPESAVVEAELRPESLNPLGMAHGGFVYSMCDIAAGVIIAQYADKFVTLSGNLYFMRRTVNVVDTCVFDDSGAVTAKGTFEIYIME